MDQLKRAEKLVKLLNVEAKRWEKTLDEINLKINKLVGTMLVCAGYCVYLNNFDQTYRNMFEKSWYNMCEENNIPINQEFDFVKQLCEDNQIREWEEFGLPSDLKSR